MIAIAAEIGLPRQHGARRRPPSDFLIDQSERFRFYLHRNYKKSRPMKTASYFNCAGHGRIGITRRTPRGQPPATACTVSWHPEPGSGRTTRRASSPGIARRSWTSSTRGRPGTNCTNSPTGRNHIFSASRGRGTARATGVTGTWSRSGSASPSARRWRARARPTRPQGAAGLRSLGLTETSRRPCTSASLHRHAEPR